MAAAMCRLLQSRHEAASFAHTAPVMLTASPQENRYHYKKVRLERNEVVCLESSRQNPDSNSAWAGEAWLPAGLLAWCGRLVHQQVLDSLL